MSQPFFAGTRLAIDGTVGDRARMVIRETQAIREAMAQRGISQRQLGEVLERIESKGTSKRPEAAVSKQLSKKRMSVTRAIVYWQAISDIAPAPIMGGPTPIYKPTGEDLAEAMHLLTKCSQAQLAKVVGYITGLLDAS